MTLNEETPNADRSNKPLREIKSESLFEGATEIVILHREEVYRLRVTKSDKLILTK